MAGYLPFVRKDRQKMGVPETLTNSFQPQHLKTACQSASTGWLICLTERVMVVMTECEEKRESICRFGHLRRWNRESEARPTSFAEAGCRGQRYTHPCLPHHTPLPQLSRAPAPPQPSALQNRVCACWSTNRLSDEKSAQCTPCCPGVF